MVRYAVEQTRLAYAGLDDKTSPANVTPRQCLDGDGDRQGEGVRYLQVRWGEGPNLTLSCRVDVGKALILDLGGTVANEDPMPPCGAADGVTREQLQNLGALVPPSGVASTATLDGHAIKPVEVVTPMFIATVSASYPGDHFCTSPEYPNGLSLYQESVLLGHPGKLAVAYSGKKAYIAPLRKGDHVIVLDSQVGIAPRTFTYRIRVD